VDTTGDGLSRFRIDPNPQDVGAEREDVLSAACGTSIAPEVMGNGANGIVGAVKKKGV
jgi:hypothetical protein